MVALVDHSKVGQEHFIRFAGWPDIDVLITNTEVDLRRHRRPHRIARHLGAPGVSADLGGRRTRGPPPGLVAIEVAELAADTSVIAAGQAVAAGTKSTPTDVVTLPTWSASQLIRASCWRCPGSAIVGEEYGDADGGNNTGWIVDPIDGTINFLYDPARRRGEHLCPPTLHGRVVAGTVADVHRGDLLRVRGQTRRGARRSGPACAPRSGARSSRPASLTPACRAAQAEVLTRLLPACRDIRCMGSAALNLCWVGCGRIDAYYERDLKPYDYAAGALIAAEAGARVEKPSQANHGLTFAATATIADSVRSLVA
ncbi:MAG: inositol monophosphatase family protein [Acidimicrobiales bacterium]